MLISYLTLLAAVAFRADNVPATPTNFIGAVFDLSDRVIFVHLG